MVRVRVAAMMNPLCSPGAECAGFGFRLGNWQGAVQ